MTRPITESRWGKGEFMRRTIYAVVVGAMFMTLTAASPVLAEAPVTFTDSVTFTDVNPCTGVDHEVTIDFLVSIHEHQNNTVVHVDRAGTTDSGFTMIAGTNSFVANSNVERGTLTDQWRHPDGSKFVAQGQFVLNLNQGEVLVDNGSLRCLGNH
jgi:hypothetical protein